MYPRLDVNVSTTLNHLLKCPFSVHPKSKKLSIPFRAEFIDSFDPDSVVTLEQLTEEYSKLATDGTFDCYLEPERVRNKPPESIAKYTNMNESILVMEELVGLLRKDLKSESLEM
jgi:DNA primase small subunit